MKIQKKYQGVIPNGKIMSSEFLSDVDTYSCNYLNTKFNDIAKLREKILWTNPNPENDFDAQTISLISDDYDELIWYFISDIDNVNPLIISSTNFKKYGTQVSFNSTASLRYWARRVTYNSDTSYSIEDCHLLSGTGDSISNNSLVPLYVVGKKTDLFK